MANLQEIIPAIFTGPNGERLTPEQIAQRQKVAMSLLGRATDTSPDAGGWASVLTKGILGYKSGADTRAADAAIKANAEQSQANIASMLSGGAGFPSAVAAGASTTSAVATGMVKSNFNLGDNHDAIKNGIIETAQAIGADPVDLATAISYETGGTFNPTKAGPTTQWGQHRGLIQFGEPQAKQYGVDWSNPIGSQLGANGAIANYFRSSGFKPGMSGLDLYSTINAGSPGRYSASDANSGGAPGSVADKWNNQMAGHRAKALALLGGGGSVASTPQQAIAQVSPVSDPEGLFAPGADVSQADLDFARQATGPEVSTPETAPSVAPYDFTGSPQLSSAPTLSLAPESGNNFDARWNAGSVQQTIGPQVNYTPGQVVTGADGKTYQNVEQIDGSYALTPYNPNSQAPAADPRLLALNDQMLGGVLSPSGTSDVAQALSGAFPAAPSADRAPVTSQTFQAPASQQQSGINPAIISALSNPYASDQERQVASLLLGRQLDANDPMKQAELQLRQAQTQAALRKANNPLGDETFFGNPVPIQNADGTIAYGQIGNKGTFRPIQLGAGQTFAPPTKTLDTGTEIIQMTQNGEVISRTPKQNREAAAQTAGGSVEGKTEAERRLAAPADMQAGQNALDILDQIEKHPGIDMGTGLWSYGNVIPGTPGYDFQNIVEQAKSGAFLSAIQQMRGMGSLSNAEGASATAAVTRMDTATSKEAFLSALNDYRKIVRQGVERAQKNIGGSQPATAGKRTSTGVTWSVE